MKVKELKALLETLPDDMECIIQKDAEGNAYSPLAGVDSDAVYIEESSWEGVCYSTNWTAEDACKTDKEWKKILKMPRSLIFHPIN